MQDMEIIKFGLYTMAAISTMVGLLFLYLSGTPWLWWKDKAGFGPQTDRRRSALLGLGFFGLTALAVWRAMYLGV